MTEARICPKCGSLNTKVVASKSYSEKCLECRHSSYNFPIVAEKDVQSFRERFTGKNSRKLWKELLTAKWHPYDWVLVFVFFLILTVSAAIFIK